MKMKNSGSRLSLVAVVAFFLAVMPLLLQAGDAFRFEIRRNATPQAYYVHVLFKGAEPADIATVARRGGVLIRYSAAREKRESFDGGGVRYFASSQSLDSVVGVPPDGDLSKMRRIDKPGWIQLIIPRRGR